MKVYTRLEIEELLARVQENEETAGKFFEVEMSVLSTLDFREFFEELLTKIRERFSVPYVWLSMIASSKATRLIHSFAASHVLGAQLGFVEKEVFGEILNGSTKPCLCNEHLHRFKPLLPDARGYVFNSIAVVPISLDGEPMGSLNFADIRSERFTPDIDTSLLEQLGVVVSICLSNVAAHEELRALAFKDPLTGLLNRRAMERALEREFERARRYKSELTLVFVDLDGFKLVNDSFGHDSGDDLLVHVATSLSGLSRGSDIVARFAGDEFILILPETDCGEAERFMKRIQAYLLEHPFVIREKSIAVQLSFGIASASDEGIDDMAAFLKKADQALYEDKARKKSSK